MGKFPCDTTFAGPNSFFAPARTDSSRRSTRSRSLPFAVWPLSSTWSPATPNSTVVVTDSGDSVRDRLDWCGRMSASSRFPQYFTRAMFGCARAVAFMGALTTPAGPRAGC